MSNTMKFYCFLFILVMILIGCSSKKVVPVDQSVNAGIDDDLRVLTQYSSEELSELNQLKLALYSGDHEASINYIRKRAEIFREKAFDRALLAYWDYKDKLPTGDTPVEIITELEAEGLMPFWPTDPVTDTSVDIIATESEIIDWSTFYISIGENGAFDYVGVYHNSMSPFEPLICEHDNSPRFDDNITHSYYVDSDHWSGQVPLPTSSEEAFADMVKNLFLTLIDDSFFLNESQVPTDLAGLLAGFAIVNPRSWKHPVGPLSDELPGSFEYGTDPEQNGYYFTFMTSEYGEVTRCYRFVKTEIDDEYIFDFSTSMSYIEPVMDDKIFQNRIPILTDELFAGPIPEL